MKGNEVTNGILNSTQVKLILCQVPLGAKLNDLLNNGFKVIGYDVEWDAASGKEIVRARLSKQIGKTSANATIRGSAADFNEYVMGQIP